MNKKYVAKTVALTATQVELLDLAKTQMEVGLGITLSYSQVITALSKHYIKQGRA